MDRRNFLQQAARGTALAAAAAMLAQFRAAEAAAAEAGGQPLGPAPGKETREGDMIYRTLGRTGERVSLVGMGGFHLAKTKDEAEAIRLVHAAMDNGINFMDNAWVYFKGVSEERMGKALADGGRRDKVFLMSKIMGRSRAEANEQIETSLRRLRTDRFDLMQYHALQTKEEVDQVFAEGGAVEAVEAARKAGKIRYVGFTGHTSPEVHRYMIEQARARDYAFDTCQMPLNLSDATFKSFRHQVVPELLRDRVAVLGMKPFAGGEILKKKKDMAPEACLRYAMSLPTAVVITGMENQRDLDQALAVVRGFKPLTSEEETALVAATREVALGGACEPFKVTGISESMAWYAARQRA